MYICVFQKPLFKGREGWGPQRAPDRHGGVCAAPACRASAAPAPRGAPAGRRRVSCPNPYGPHDGQTSALPMGGCPRRTNCTAAPAPAPPPPRPCPGPCLLPLGAAQGTGSFGAMELGAGRSVRGGVSL